MEFHRPLRLAKLSPIKKTGAKFNHRGIQAKKFGKSFGEIISINLSDQEVNISSKPLLFTTIFDFGKNYENIKFIKSII